MQNNNSNVNTDTNTIIEFNDGTLKLKKAIIRFGIFVFFYSLLRFLGAIIGKFLLHIDFFTLFPDSWVSGVELIISSIIFYIIPLIPFFMFFPRKLYKRNNKTYIGSEYTKPKAFSFYPATYTLGILTSSLTILILIGIAYLVDFNISSDDITNYFSTEQTNIFLQFSIIAIFVPIMEEFFFRGVLLGTLRPFGDKFAIIASGLFFGIMHGNILQAPFATVIGIVLGYIYVRSNSLIVTIGFHALINGTSTILSYYSIKLVDFLFDKASGEATTAQGVDYIIATLFEWILFAVIICGALSLIRLVIKYIRSGIKKVRVSYLENEYFGLTERKKFALLFSNPFVILGFAICLFYIISSTLDFINSCNLQ